MATFLLKKRPQDLLESATATPALVEVPAASYLMIEGQGDPGASAEFDAAWETLLPLAAALQRLLDPRASECPLPMESLRWTDESGGKEQETWTLMVALPEEATLAHLEKAMVALHAEGHQLPAFQSLRFGRLHEGRAVQLLHRGPASHDAPIIERLERFVQPHGLRLSGPRHEIYRGDPRRSDDGSLETLVLYPVIVPA